MQFFVAGVTEAIDRITLEGRLDAAGTERIETTFTAAASAGGRHVLLDLGGVDFIGSLGIRLLLSNARVVQRRGRQFVLFNARPQAVEVFDTVALGALLPIVADEAAALALIPG